VGEAVERRAPDQVADLGFGHAVPGEVVAQTARQPPGVVPQVARCLGVKPV
jgi:hypothetical protein